MSQNWVTVLWSGPKWLMKFDPKAKWDCFWRARTIQINSQKTTDDELAAISKMRFVEKVISTVPSTNFESETVKQLKQNVSDVWFPDLNEINQTSNVFDVN